MTLWQDRSPVPRAMLNPALLAAVLASAAIGYSREVKAPIPYALGFIVAPLVLHEGTREALPSTLRSHMPVWVSRQPVLMAGLPARAKSLKEPVREGIRFGMRQGILHLDGAGLSAAVPVPKFEGDVQAMSLKALFVGRWLTKLDRPATAFAIFGLTV